MAYSGTNSNYQILLYYHGDEGTIVTQYEVVDYNGFTQFIGTFSDCYRFIETMQEIINAIKNT